MKLYLKIVEFFCGRVLEYFFILNFGVLGRLYGDSRNGGCLVMGLFM